MEAACNKNLPTQTNDVIVNPENPDSKPGVRGEFTLKPVGEKTRSIASLHDDILPPGAKGDFGEFCAARG